MENKQAIRRGRKQSPAPPRYARRWAGVAMILAGLGLLAQQGDVPSPVTAQENRAQENAVADAAPPQVGYLIPVALPITGNSDQAVRTQIRRVLENQKDRGDAQPPVIVLQFGQSEEQTGAGSEFGRAYELARLLMSEELGTARTVAYIPHRLEGHALLPAMACQEIVMHKGAEIGRAGDAGEAVGKVEREAYEEVYDRRQTLPAAVAVGTIDPSVEVLRANVNDAARWIFAEQLPGIEKQPGYGGYETVIKRGVLGNFTAEELRSKYGFISRVVSDKADLAAALKLAKLSDDPKLANEWIAIQLDIRGPMSDALVTQTLQGLQERMQAAAAAGRPINFLCLWIDSAGGSASSSVTLINALADDIDRGQIYVAAYVPNMARADAAMVAMACDSISIAPAAMLGGDGEAVLVKDDVRDLVERAKSISKSRGKRWSLWAAMVDRNLEVHQYTRAGTGQIAYFCAEELDEQRDKDQWQRGPAISQAGTLLLVNGERANELGMVDHVTANFNDFRDNFSLKELPEVVRRNSAHSLIESLRNNWWLPALLIMIGSSALMSELSSPGVGAPGFVALLCFSIYFWLALMEGSATALEVLLFLVGVACIAVELFVLPGFGVFGIGGAAMVVVSIVLASQTWYIPRTTYQVEQLPASLFTVVGAGVGVLVGVLLISRYAHSAPGLRALMLAPPAKKSNKRSAAAKR